MTNSSAKTVTFSTPEMAFAQSALGQQLRKMLSEGSVSYQAIADFLLRNQVKATALGVEELAENCKVSTATVSRFARDIGFANYAAMRSQVATTVQGVFQPVEKLRNTIAQGSQSSSTASQSMEYAIANIGAAKQAVAEPDFSLVVKKLIQAKTVYVMGFGLSAHLAALLALHLQPFCPHVVEVVGYGGTEVAAGHLANITSKDVLILISFPRYALDSIKLAKFARDRSACIVSITDSPASPLAALGDHLLLAQSMHPVLPSSSTAALAVIEALVASIMVSNKKNVEKAAKLTEAISAYLLGSVAPSKAAERPSKIIPKP